MYSVDGHSGRPTTEVVDAGKVYLTTGRLGNYSKVPLAMSFMPSESNACWHEHVEFVVNTFNNMNRDLSYALHDRLLRILSIILYCACNR